MKCFNDMGAGMTGWPGKWPRKCGSLKVTFLIARMLLLVHFDHPIDEKKRVSMGHDFEDVVDILHDFVSSSGVGSSSPKRRSSCWTFLRRPSMR